MSTITGTSGNDTISGGNGVDIIYGGGGNDILSGGNGVDTLYGEDGNDQLTGDNGADNLSGGAGDDLIDGLNGFDTAYYSGLIEEYTFVASAGYLHVLHMGGAGADGHDQLIRVERLVFADRVIDIGSGHNRPVAIDDHVSIDEDTGLYNSGAAGVLANDFDFDGDTLTVTGGTFTGTYGTLVLNSNGTYSYTLFASAQALAVGENVQDSFAYTVTDNDGSDTGQLVFHIAGVNDAPTANPDTTTSGENEIVLIDVLANDSDIDHNAMLTVTAASVASGQGSASVVSNQVEFDPGTDFDYLAEGESVDVVVSYDIEDEHGATSSSTVTITVTGTNDAPTANPDTTTAGENEIVLIDVLANDSDVDNNAVLTLTAASAPVDQGIASVVSDQVQFDPGTDFDYLAEGESVDVVVSYDIEDEHGATSSSTVTITVTGTNDEPVANPDTTTAGENEIVLIDVLANDSDADHNAVLLVTAASAPAGQGTASVVGNQVQFDPGTDFDYLNDGESVDVIVDYTIEDEHGAQSVSTVTITVQGEDDPGAVIIGTPDDDTLTGTPGDDIITALGGDDSVSGLGGADLIDGGDGADFLSGDAGNDQLLGQAGNDSLSGDTGNDQLSGGDGFDSLFGDAGDDVVTGGNDGDVLAGGDGNDDLSGEAGNDVVFGQEGDDQLSGGDGDDSLDGGDGDDTIDGGDGQDNLSGGLGTNELNGGLGNDTITADSTDGAQTIDGGDGNDTIVHYYRTSASTITTGLGSDTIELAYANIGAAALTITDFTTGAGGDIFRIEGDDGALLNLLSGWDGSANPFGTSGFLRLQQSGADTVLQWDQDGTAGGANWETLVVFQNTLVGNFTDANFAPAYPPDGSAPTGQTITGTAAGETLTGTIGGDTINALGGNDFVFGRAGDDQINGGDGGDFLNGEGGDDIITGGNDGDQLSGGDGNDDLSGQAGVDSVSGDNGDDQLSGGDGSDFLSGDAGNDVIAGGNDDDQLLGGEGDDDLDGGAGADTLSDFIGTNSLAGGVGNDQITAGSSDGAQTVDGGDGDDTIIHYYRTSASTITTGSGSDTIELAHADIGTAALTVTDFTTGGGGDMFRLTGADGALLSLLIGWDGSSNPFGSFLRLEQDGSDTLLQWDQDGGGSNWETLVVFENTTAGDFTDANFVPGYDPDGTPPPGAIINGTAGDDFLEGTIGGDTITAFAGSDAAFGLAGDDTIYGGDGFDNLFGNEDDDYIDGGNDDDFIDGGDGNDQLLGQAGNDLVFGGEGDDQIDGGDGLDNLTGEGGNDSLAGGNDDDVLSGGVGVDTLDGGAGNDMLTGGFDSDVLTGGTGVDTFSFESVGDGPDEITDFVSGTDLIQILASNFGGGLVAGDPVSLVSGADPAASTASGQFLYDTDDGRLFWDADGTGSDAAILIATLSNVPTLTTSDFVVI